MGLWKLWKIQARHEGPPASVLAGSADGSGGPAEVAESEAFCHV